jgi:hypothetical protein
MKMKRILTLLMILALTSVGNMQAQVLKRSRIAPSQVNNIRQTVINAGDNQLWWGYNSSNHVCSIGIGVADTYHCAFFLAGDHDVVSGKKLCAVRFGLLASHVSNVVVWTASTLPATDPAADNTLWMASVDKSKLSESIDVPLTEPYDIPAEGVYVGYSFTITSVSTTNDQYPVMTGGTDMPGGLLLRTNKSIPAWTDLDGQKFGVLNMKVLLEGTFADYVVSPTSSKSSYYAQVGQTADVELSLANNGQAAVSSIAYTITADGETSQEQTLTLGSPIAPFTVGTATITIDADATAQSSTKTLTITKVNGEANMASNASTDITLFTLDRLIPRNVVVEEFTGTGCGWCPRGLVGMEKLRQTFGERFIGIGIHQYNSGDAMYFPNYPNLNWTGAPSCRIDRGEDIDPYYGSVSDICEDFSSEMNEPAMVSVDVSGVIDEDMTKVDATAYVEPLFDTNSYKLELALVADGLSGTSSAWWQSNYYAQYTSAQVPDRDLQIFTSGGKYGTSSVKNWIFNDVAIGTSYVNGINQVGTLGSMTGGEVRKVTYTLAMPTKATLREALNKGVVYVVALVIDSDGRIANAAKRQVVDESEFTGVNAVSTHTSTKAGVYSLGGTQLSTLQRGINIVRMSDGTIRKVKK